MPNSLMANIEVGTGHTRDFFLRQIFDDDTVQTVGVEAEDKPQVVPQVAAVHVHVGEVLVVVVKHHHVVAQVWRPRLKQVSSRFHVCYVIVGGPQVIVEFNDCFVMVWGTAEISHLISPA